MTIKPSKGILFCKAEEAETVTKSGFLLAQSAANKPLIAEVINVGEGITDIKQKDRIVYKSYATSDINLEGNDYFLIAAEDVLGIVL